MKRSILLIVLLFSIAIGNSQTITEVTNQMLGQIIDNKDNQRIKTDYGTFNFKIKTDGVHTGKEKVIKIVVTISNDFQMYDSIINSGDYQTYRVGSLWTDLNYDYEEVITKEFKTLSEAKAYADTYINSPIEAYNEVEIFKHPKKERYKVGRLIYSKNKRSVRFDDNDSSYVEIERWKVVD